MRCYRCMKEFNDEYEICPHCGYIVTAKGQFAPALKPGTMLQNRYWIGIVVGFGGFGITYKAWDTQLNVVVAIKEFYPSGIVCRATESCDVKVCYSDREEEYKAGVRRFLEEARNLAKFSKHENIVNVYNFFQENQTCYIIMEYLDGISMKYFLETNDGKISILYAKEIILATAQALDTLHKENILHRDISPDNIFLCSDGKIKLIDFGASRLSRMPEANRRVVVKPGYAPPEQYQRQSKQGAWTDIYALGATFYRAVTGKAPLEAVDRQRDDTLARPSQYNSELPEYMDAAIMKAMALDVNERFHTVGEFTDVLLHRKVVKIPVQKKRKQKVNEKKSYSFIVGVFACLLCVFLVAYTMVHMYQDDNVELELWVCAKEGEEPQILQKYYQEICDKLILSETENVDISVEVATIHTYETELITAMEESSNIIFDSTFVSDALLLQAKELTDSMSTLNGEMYYCLNDDYLDFPGNKQLPIGFDLSVKYVLRDMNRNGRIIKEFKDLSWVSEYDIAKEMSYGTFANIQQRLQGELAIMSSDEPRYTYSTLLSVHKACDGREYDMAVQLLQTLLSYEGQLLLHAGVHSEFVRESRMLSLHELADKKYRHEICTALLNLDDDIEKADE